MRSKYVKPQQNDWKVSSFSN